MTGEAAMEQKACVWVLPLPFIILSSQPPYEPQTSHLSKGTMQIQLAL
jgi:hypothetical protein